MIVSKELAPYFRALSMLGVLLLIGDTALSAKFGYSLSWDMAVIVGAISLASGLFPVVAIFFHRVGWKPLAYGIAGIWAPIFLFNVWTNMGVSVGNRLGEAQQATKVRHDYDAIITGQAALENKLKVLQTQREELPKQLKELTETKVGAWSVSTVPSSPEELDGQIAAKKLEVENESKRGGCKSKCEARTNELAHLQALRGKAAEIKSLDDRIATTIKSLDETKKELKTADKGISTTKNQSTGHASIFNMDFGSAPDERSLEVASRITGVGTAFILALAAMGTTLAGAYPALMKVGRINVNARDITIDGDEPAPPRAMNETHRKIQDRMDEIKKDQRSINMFVNGQKADPSAYQRIWEEAMKAVMPDMKTAGA